MDAYLQIIAIVSSFLTILSVLGNIIQYNKKRESEKALRSYAHSSYNHQYLIARACTRCRTLLDENKGNLKKRHINMLLEQILYINGSVDTSRTSIIAYSREHLKFTPYYEHPAIPGEEPSDFVRYGGRPEVENNKKQ